MATRREWLQASVMSVAGYAFSGLTPLFAQSKSENRIVTDLYGRNVEIPQTIRRIVCTGNGALRLASYLQCQNLLVGVESVDLRYEQNPVRDYAYCHHQTLKQLPIIGKGGGGAYTANPESLLSVQPDVIFTGYTRQACEQLARETGLPVVSTYYLSQQFFDPTFYQAIELMGSILGKVSRQQAIVQFIRNTQADLKKRVTNLPDSERVRVYAGAITYSGARGFTGTYSDFGPFQAVNARNVADNKNHSGFYETSLENIMEWNPDVIFIDSANLGLVAQEAKIRGPFFDALAAVQNKRIYAMPSFNNYATNITYALMDAYFVGMQLYPDRFSDLVFAEKCGEILQFFLGRDYFEEMQKTALFYGQVGIDGVRLS